MELQDILPALGNATMLRNGTVVENVLDFVSSGHAVSLLLVTVTPLVIGVLTNYRDRIAANASKKIAKFRHEHIRTIEYLASTDYYQNLRSDNRNNVLQKAILLHLADRKRGEKKAVNEYTTGGFLLMEPSTESQDWDERLSTDRSSESLKQLRLAVLPAQGAWEEIEPGLLFMHTERDEPNGDLWERQCIFTYTLKTARPGGDQYITKFLDKCLTQYKDVLRKQEDKARYMYHLLLGMSKTDDNGVKPPVFKKYKLSDDKTFESLFFPHKDATLRLVDDFVHRRGKFAIEGFPQKLGLLLHGPPGTGKTSFVKALATYTKRHIVSVPLGKISTNQELYDIMFERVFPCLGDDGVPQVLPFDDIIFLIEEVDAASDIVKSRKTRKNQESTLQRTETAVFELEAGEEAAAGAKSQVFEPPALERQSSTVHDSAPVLVGASEGALDALLGGEAFTSADKLDLAGLLNVLDGVVDSPGRIVIMTTNHPEKLDAALIQGALTASCSSLSWRSPKCAACWSITTATALRKKRLRHCIAFWKTKRKKHRWQRRVSFVSRPPRWSSFARKLKPFPIIFSHCVTSPIVTFPRSGNSGKGVLQRRPMQND